MNDIVIGTRVWHETTTETFGAGTVLKINEDVSPASVLVKWDTHRRNQADSTHHEDETHVKLDSLKKLEMA